jgi:hypothetical protein
VPRSAHPGLETTHRVNADPPPTSSSADKAKPKRARVGRRGPRRRKQPLPVIGWREWICFPDLGGGRVKAKVDTGARTSRLHAFDLRRVDRDGVPCAEFEIHPHQRSGGDAVSVVLPIVEERRIRSSNGRSELRPVVRVEIDLWGDPWTIELTLTRRDAMGFRMLLGREAVRGRATVDPGRSFRTGGQPRVL